MIYISYNSSIKYCIQKGYIQEDYIRNSFRNKEGLVNFDMYAKKEVLAIPKGNLGVFIFMKYRKRKNVKKLVHTNI